MVKLSVTIACIVLASCAQQDLDIRQPLPDLDPHFFRCEVQPVLVANCAFMVCHGNDERPLKIYAAKRFRLGISWDEYKTPLTEDELAANFQMVRGFVQPSNLLAEKPLDTRSGGLFHRGKDLYGSDDVFTDTNNIGYQKLVEFARGEKADSNCQPTTEVGL